jgi:hypothetical protein
MAVVALRFDYESKEWKSADVVESPEGFQDFRRTVIVRKGKAAKEAAAPDSYESVDERLRYKFSDAKTEFIWEVEIAYADGDLTTLYNLLKREIRTKAEYYEGKYSGFRVSRHDFESAFIAELLRLGRQDLTNEKYTFYEALQRAYPRRAIDVVRAQTGRRGGKVVSGQKAIESELLPLNEITERSIISCGRSVEDVATDRALIGAMNSDPALTNDERKLFKALADDPDASLRELATICGFSNAMKAKRTLESLREKLAKYNPYNS